MPVRRSAQPPAERSQRPPVILVHGAANSSRVWAFWERDLADNGWSVYSMDLRGHGPPNVDDPADLSSTSMRDYADDVEASVAQFSQRPILVGWSMGGLVAMMAASSGSIAACVALEPSPPAQRIDPSVRLRKGEFAAEEYGITSRDPEHQPTMPDLDREERTIALGSLRRESRLARDEGKRGIVIESLPCPLLIVTRTANSKAEAERYEVPWLKADHIAMEAASHRGLVLNRRALGLAIPAVLRWVQSATMNPTLR